MARHNGTPAVTIVGFLAELFEDWSDDRLSEFVYDSRANSLDRRLSAALSDAADIAGRLAEAVLEERDAYRRNVFAIAYPAASADLEAVQT